MDESEGQHPTTEMSSLSPAPKPEGLNFNSLPREIRIMIFKLVFVGLSQLLFDEDPCFHFKKIVDQHVVENLALLQYGKLPSFELTREARDVFWSYNSFQVKWHRLGNFSLGINVCGSLYIIARDWVRNLRIDICTTGRIYTTTDKFMYNPSSTLRQLLDFPMLQRLDVVITMPMLPHDDSYAEFRVGHIKHVCLKLRKKYKKGFTVFTERSACKTYEEEPYEWDLVYEIVGEDDDASGQVGRVDGGHGDEVTMLDTSRAEIALQNHNETAATGDVISVHSDDESASAESEEEGPDPFAHDPLSDYEVDQPDPDIIFERENITWIWMPPTQETLRKVAKRKGDWMDKINVSLFQKVV